MEYRFEIVNSSIKIYRNNKEISFKEFFDDFQKASEADDQSPQFKSMMGSFEKLYDHFEAGIGLQVENVTQDTREIENAWGSLVKATSQWTDDVGKLFNQIGEAGSTIVELLDSTDKVTPQGELSDEGLEDLKRKAEEILSRADKSVSTEFRTSLEKILTLKVGKLSYRQAGKELVEIAEIDLPKFYENNASWLVEELTSCEFFYNGEPILGNDFLIELRKLSS
jgi:hypothetical protein